MSEAIKVLQVGIGYQGVRAVVMAHEQGYDLIGAVDTGDKVGKSLRELTGNQSLPDLTVKGSIDDAIASAGKPDVILMCVGAAPHVVVDLICKTLELGIDIVTITEELFGGEGELAERVDRIAKANGVSVVPTGIQDPLWIQLPSVLASMTHNVVRVSVEDNGDCSIFSKEIAYEEAGVGLTPQEHADWATERLHQQPIQGAPLRELAQRMGLTPKALDYKIEAVTRDTATDWPNGNKSIPAGDSVGTRYLIAFDTEEGVKFSGSLTYSLSPDLTTFFNACGTSKILVEGDNNVLASLPNLPADSIPLAMVRRIPDALAAKPGIARASTLPNTNYRPSSAK